MGLQIKKKHVCYDTRHTKLASTSYCAIMFKEQATSVLFGRLSCFPS